ncbi:Rho guanine nucleotide exchange factor 17 [Fragariocoptes setiger]|uniref:Rho guanine nucleotide exchange factor 17 n=1 Tax=Fragariocoptes setiger TaxID=1670756 RepID=A0ABQ7SBC3_9ACAR|nr:Rho guanine nucleotide exchange factor 17 [Fragariocoptes setiger]
MRPLKSPDNRNLIESNLVDGIFYTIPEILAHHEAFLVSLQDRLTPRWDTNQIIGDVFIDAFTKQPIIDTYTAFINNWKNARQAIKMAKQAKPAFEKFLEELLKHTPEDHPDHVPLIEAQKQIHELALNIDRAEREVMHHEQQQQQLKDIENLFDGHVELAHPSREFIRFDLISTPGGLGSKKERVIFLFSDLLVMTSIKKKTSRRSNLASALSSSTDLILLEGNKFKLLMRVPLDNVEITSASLKQRTEATNAALESIASSCVANASQLAAQSRATVLANDLALLSQIQLLLQQMQSPHQALEDNSRELQQIISRKYAQLSAELSSGQPSGASVSPASGPLCDGSTSTGNSSASNYSCSTTTPATSTSNGKSQLQITLSVGGSSQVSAAATTTNQSSLIPNQVSSLTNTPMSASTQSSSSSSILPNLPLMGSQSSQQQQNGLAIEFVIARNITSEPTSTMTSPTVFGESLSSTSAKGLSIIGGIGTGSSGSDQALASSSTTVETLLAIFPNLERRIAFETAFIEAKRQRLQVQQQHLQREKERHLQQVQQANELAAATDLHHHHHHRVHQRADNVSQHVICSHPLHSTCGNQQQTRELSSMLVHQSSMPTRIAPMLAASGMHQYRASNSSISGDTNHLCNCTNMSSHNYHHHHHSQPASLDVCCEPIGTLSSPHVCRCSSCCITDKASNSLTSKPPITCSAEHLHQNTLNSCLTCVEMQQKQGQLTEMLRPQMPELQMSVPVPKPRSGLQFTSAEVITPSLEHTAIHDNLGRLWLCMSNGYISHICLMKLVLLTHSTVDRSSCTDTTKEATVTAQVDQPSCRRHISDSGSLNLLPVCVASSDVCKARITSIVRVASCNHSSRDIRSADLIQGALTTLHDNYTMPVTKTDLTDQHQQASSPDDSTNKIIANEVQVSQSETAHNGPTEIATQENNEKQGQSDIHATGNDADFQQDSSTLASGSDRPAANQRFNTAIVRQHLDQLNKLHQNIMSYGDNKSSTLLRHKPRSPARQRRTNNGAPEGRAVISESAPPSTSFMSHFQQQSSKSTSNGTTSTDSSTSIGSASVTTAANMQQQSLGHRRRTVSHGQHLAKQLSRPQQWRIDDLRQPAQRSLHGGNSQGNHEAIIQRHKVRHNTVPLQQIGAQHLRPPTLPPRPLVHQTSIGSLTTPTDDLYGSNRCIVSPLSTSSNSSTTSLSLSLSKPIVDQDPLIYTNSRMSSNIANDTSITNEEKDLALSTERPKSVQETRSNYAITDTVGVLGNSYRVSEIETTQHEPHLQMNEHKSSTKTKKKVSQATNESTEDLASSTSDSATSGTGNSLWLGCDDGSIVVIDCIDELSACGQCRNSHTEIQLPAAVNHLLVYKGQVLTALSNGQLAIFAANKHTPIARRRRILSSDTEAAHDEVINTSDSSFITTHGNSYSLEEAPKFIDVSKTGDSIDKLCLVGDSLWCANKNIVSVLNLDTLTIDTTIAVSQEANHVINCMQVSSNEQSIWISMDDNPSVFLYDTLKFDLLLELKLTDTVNKMLSRTNDIIRQHKSACLRPTALMCIPDIASQRDLLWIGTSAGVIINAQVPLITSESRRISVLPNLTGLSRGHAGQVRFLSSIDLQNIPAPTTVDPESTASYYDEEVNRDGTQTDYAPSTRLAVANKDWRYLVISGGDGMETYVPFGIQYIVGSHLQHGSNPCDTVKQMTRIGPDGRLGAPTPSNWVGSSGVDMTDSQQSSAPCRSNTNTIGLDDNTNFLLIWQL